MIFRITAGIKTKGMVQQYTVQLLRSMACANTIEKASIFCLVRFPFVKTVFVIKPYKYVVVNVCRSELINLKTKKL